MSDAFTQRLAERIEHPDAATLEDTLIDAGEMIRLWHRFSGDTSRAGAVGPFSEPIEYPQVSADDAERLHEAILNFVRSHPRHPFLCSAIHALQHCARPETRPLLVEILRDALGRDSNALYQTMLTLEALGESLFGDVRSTSYDEVEQNERRARAYLARHANAA